MELSKFLSLKRNPNLFGSFTALLACIVLSTPSYSETHKDKVDYLLNLSLAELANVKITVASHFSESPLVVANTVESISRTDWKNNSSRHLWDVLAKQPGTWVTESPVGTLGVQYRGLALDPGVRGTAMLVDGIPVNGVSFQTGLYFTDSIGLGTLDRIEIIRGPSSVLYGTDAFQAAVSMHTYSADKEELELIASAGTTDNYMSTLRWSSLPIAGWRISTSFQYQQDNPRNTSVFALNGASDTAPGLDDSETAKLPSEQYTGSITLRSSGKSNTSSYMSYLYTAREQKSALVAVQSFLGTTDQETDFWMIHGGTDTKLDHDISLNTKVYHWESQFDWLLLGLFGATYPGFDQHAREYRNGVELIFKQATNSWNTQWSAGYSFSNFKIADFRNVFKFEASTPLSEIPGVSEYSRNVHSIFAHSKTPIVEGETPWHLILGARLDEYDDFGTHFTPSLGLIYQPDFNSAVKVLYGQAFRAPAAGEIGQSSDLPQGATFGNPDIEAEIIDTYEIVMMRETDRYQAEFVLFYTKLEDGIVRVPLPTSDPRFHPDNRTYGNVSKSESQGAEFKYSVQRDSLKLGFDVSYAQGENMSSNIDYDAYPTWIANIHSTYALPNGWEISGFGRYMADRKTSQTSTDEFTSSNLNNYYRFDLNLEKEIDRHWSFSLDILNLLDKSDNYIGAVSGKEIRNHEHGISGWLTISRK